MQINPELTLEKAKTFTRQKKAFREQQLMLESTTKRRPHQWTKSKDRTRKATGPNLTHSSLPWQDSNLPNCV